MMDQAPVQIGRHHLLVGFRESGDDAYERRAAMNDDGGFIATSAAPIKKRHRRPRERFSHVLRDGIILACHGHLSKAGNQYLDPIFEPKCYSTGRNEAASGGVVGQGTVLQIRTGRYGCGTARYSRLPRAAEPVMSG